MSAIKWTTAPQRSEWGAWMMVADVAITKDSTLTLFCDAADVESVDAMLSVWLLPPPVPRGVEHPTIHAAEEAECVHKCLDRAGTPRADATGAVFSLWGRIEYYAHEQMQNNTPPMDGAALTGMEASHE